MPSSSLKMSQKLAEDLGSSIAAAKPLFHRLSHWRESLPPEVTHSNHVNCNQKQARYPATVYFSYLTLVACIWRAVLRATVRSSEPAQIIDINDIPEPGSMSMDEFTPDLTQYPEMNFQLAQDSEENGSLIQELYEASLNCASTIIDFSANMSMSAFSEFWHSCKSPRFLLVGPVIIISLTLNTIIGSRKSFALVSNFLVLLLIQAPDFNKASMAKQLLHRWRETLDSQCTVFPITSLAKVRLSSYYSVGLGETFQLPPHVEDALRSAL